MAHSVDSRLSAVDGLRGLAAAGVAVAHIYYFFGGQHVFPAAQLVTAQLGYLVELFFLISGFTMMLTFEENPLNRVAAIFWVKRFFRIAPLFYLCVFLNWMILEWRGLHFEGLYTPISVAANVLLAFNLSPPLAESLTPAGWTIGVEVVFYVLFPAIAYFAARRGWLLLGVFCACCLLAYVSKFVLAVSLSDQRTIVYLWNYFAINFLPMFLAGMLIYKWWKGTAVWLEGRRARLLGWVCFAVFLLGAIILTVGNVVPAPWTHPAWAFDFAFLLLWGLFSSSRAVTNSVVAGLGRISYSVYLLHGIVISFVFKLIDLNFLGIAPVDLGDPWTVATPMVIATLILIPASILTYLTVETPMNNLARRASRWLSRGKQAPVVQPSRVGA